MRTSDVYQDIVDAQVRTHFDYSKDDIFNQIDGAELLTEYEPDTPEEQVSGLGGAGYGTLTIEGQQYGNNRLWREYPKAITLRKYTSELSYTEEDVHWIMKANEQKRMFKLDEISSNGLRPLVGNINRDVSKMVYLSTGTTFFTGGDGLSLVNSAHTIRKTGGTQSNVVTTNYQLTANAVDTAINQMNRFQGMNGVQLQKVRRVRLVVPVELEGTALQIKNSIYGGNGPLSANLGLSKGSKDFMKYRGIDFDVVVLPEIPSSYSAYWWLIDLDRAAKRFLLAWGWKPRMAKDTMPQNGTFCIDASSYFGPHAVGWQWIIGSDGTGSAP